MKKIFESDVFAIEIFRDDEGRYFIRYDAGTICDIYENLELSKEDAEKAQKSAQDADEVILKYQNRKLGLTQ